jgi:Domain of Unknown Function (DUF1080)
MQNPKGIAMFADSLRKLSRIGVSTGLVALVCLGSAAGQQPAQNQSSAPAATPGAQPSRFHEPDPIDFNEHTGFVQIFDGKTLNKWDGDTQSWRVEDGAIVGESTAEKTRNNTYISYHGEEAKDFDLKLEIKVEKGGGSGIQYRSAVGQPWMRLRPGQPLPNLAWMMTGP